MDRRSFLAGAACVAAPVSAIAAEPTKTPYEQALWHISELERLIAADGGRRPIILVQSAYGQGDYGSLALNAYGETMDEGNIFRRSAQAA